MKCEDVVEALHGPATQTNGILRAEAAVHIMGCEACRDAERAIKALDEARGLAVPSPDASLFVRAMRAAAEQRPSAGPWAGRGFWIGTAVGAALAASLALAVVGLRTTPPAQPSSSLPQISLAVNETRDVSIALDAPQALEHARVRVVLSGAIGLVGFDGQREISWYTNLDPGTNVLTLPVVALGSNGGQLLVEVEHSERRRTFLVDVHSA